MSEGFVAGFAARHDTAAHLLAAAFAPPPGFAPRDIRERVASSSGPRHFSPADPARNPTAGWDPLAAAAEATPFVDPIQAAHAAGYAEGLAAAAAARAEAGDRDASLLTDLAAALASGDRLDRERVAHQLRQTVLFLVAQLVGDTGVSPERLTGRIEAAAELLSDAAESALLRLNPEDVALVEGKLPKTIFAAGDASVPRGSFVLESASTVVEDGPELWLEQLAQVIDRVPVPTTPC